MANKQKEEKTSQIKDILSLKLVVLEAIKRVKSLDERNCEKIKQLESLEKEG